MADVTRNGVQFREDGQKDIDRSEFDAVDARRTENVAHELYATLDAAAQYSLTFGGVLL